MPDESNRAAARTPRRSLAASALSALALAVCLAAAAALLRLPAGSAAPPAGAAPAALLARGFTDAKSAALEGLSFVKKVYRIPEDALVAPEPDPNAYGETTDPAVLARVVADAAALLDGQTLVWTPETALREGTSLHYYRDASILALTWQETLGGRVQATFAEVKLADASQLRRKLAGDVYGSPIQKFPAELAAECRTVLATSGDFYRYQKKGVHVYGGELYRCDALATLDTCFFSRAGDMLFVHAGELADEAAARRYIAENDVLFSVCFGPIVIEDGADVTPLEPPYPLGETRRLYSRCLMAQVDELHYLTMVVYTESLLKTAAGFLLDKGVTHAYTLDGGQTGSIILGGEHMNPFQYKSPRTQSDILCFTTALPAPGED